MNSINEKLAKICGELLMYGNIKSVEKPVFGVNAIFVGVVVPSGTIDVELSYSALAKAHDYSLDSLILNILRTNDLL